MQDCKVFKNFRERSEWVELRLMARAMEHGYKVSKPFVDSASYDVGVESVLKGVQGSSEVHALPYPRRE